jgi:hypothetical protein
MLAGVDLDLDPQRLGRRVFRLKPKGHGGQAGPLFALRDAHPAFQYFPNPIEHRADWPRLTLNQIDILGITLGAVEEQFVQRGPAPENQLAADFGV